MFFFLGLSILTVTMSIFINKKCYMYMLISLEMLALLTALVLMYFSGLSLNSGDFFIMLTVITAEAALGLTLMVNIIRVNGNDMMMSSVKF